MQGKKLELVKSTTSFVIDQMTDKDRMSIVDYDTDA